MLSSVFCFRYSFWQVKPTYHQVYNNGDEKVVALMSVSYSTGEAEDITFEIREEATEKLVFHNSDYTDGYHGYINFDEFVRA